MRSPETPRQRHEAQQRLDAMRSRVVDQWVPLIGAPILPAVGSSLAADDAQGWATSPPSHIAWTGIVAAIDAHEHFLTSFTDPGRLHDTGHRVLARSALTSAALAVCVLCPPRRTDRIGFALRCAYDDLAAERRAVQALRDSPSAATDPLVPGGWDEFMARLDRRREDLLAAADALPLSRTKLRRAPGFADAVTEAAGLLDSDIDVEHLRAGLGFVLAQLSSTVHMGRWAMMLTVTEVREDAEGRSFARLDTHLTDLVEMAGAGAIMLRHAIHTFRRRAHP